MKKILLLFIILSLVACGEKKPQVEFKDEEVTVDLNEEYDLNNFITVNDENAKYTVDLDEENSKIIITFENGEKIEKDVTIIPKKIQKFSELDMETGFILFTSDENSFSYSFADQKYNCYEGGSMFVKYDNDTGTEVDLAIEPFASFGFPEFHVSYDDATNIKTEALFTAYALSEDGSGTELVDRSLHNINLRYIPYQGDMKIKVLAGSLRVRTSPSLDSETIRNVNEGDILTSYERKISEGYVWDRIGENEWVANGNLNTQLAEYID